MRLVNPGTAGGGIHAARNRLPARRPGRPPTSLRPSPWRRGPPAACRRAAPRRVAPGRLSLCCFQRSRSSRSRATSSSSSLNYGQPADPSCPGEVLNGRCPAATVALPCVSAQASGLQVSGRFFYQDPLTEYAIRRRGRADDRRSPPNISTLPRNLHEDDAEPNEISQQSKKKADSAPHAFVGSKRS